MFVPVSSSFQPLINRLGTAGFPDLLASYSIYFYSANYLNRFQCYKLVGHRIDIFAGLCWCSSVFRSSDSISHRVNFKNWLFINSIKCSGRYQHLLVDNSLFCNSAVKILQLKIISDKEINIQLHRESFMGNTRSSCVLCNIQYTCLVNLQYAFQCRLNVGYYRQHKL